MAGAPKQWQALTAFIVVREPLNAVGPHPQKWPPHFGEAGTASIRGKGESRMRRPLLGMWAHSIERFADNYESCERLPLLRRAHHGALSPR